MSNDDFAAAVQAFKDLEKKRSSDWAQTAEMMDSIAYDVRRHLESQGVAEVKVSGYLIAVREDSKRYTCKVLKEGGEVRILRSGRPSHLTIAKTRGSAA